MLAPSRTCPHVLHMATTYGGAMREPSFFSREARLGIVIAAWYVGCHDPDRRGREPKRRCRQDDDCDQPRGVGGLAWLSRAAGRLRSTGQRVLGAGLHARSDRADD